MAASEPEIGVCQSEPMTPLRILGRSAEGEPSRSPLRAPNEMQGPVR